MDAIRPIDSANILNQSLAVPQPALLSETESERNYAHFELNGASILAASIGLGAHVDFWA
jgi:hypothetical protein